MKLLAKLLRHWQVRMLPKMVLLMLIMLIKPVLQLSLISLQQWSVINLFSLAVTLMMQLMVKEIIPTIGIIKQ